MAAVDGSGMEKIVYNTADRTLLSWPNGLTLDLMAAGSEKLYWIDAKLSSLFACSLENCMKDATLLVYDPLTIIHPFSITVFEVSSQLAEGEARQRPCSVVTHGMEISGNPILFGW